MKLKLGKKFHFYRNRLLYLLWKWGGAGVWNMGNKMKYFHSINLCLFNNVFSIDKQPILIVSSACLDMA